MLTIVATMAAIVLASPILLIGQAVHGQGVNQTLSAVNCDKVAPTAKFDIGRQEGVHDCTHKIIYNDQPYKTHDKDYTTGYKYGWEHEDCLPNKQILT